MASRLAGDAGRIGMIMKSSPFFSKDVHAIQSREALLRALHPAALVNLSALRKEGLFPDATGPALLFFGRCALLDRDDRLLVSNNTDRILECVRIARATTGWQDEACRMSADGSGASCRKLQPGTTAIFELPATAVDECSSLPLSFEIGDPEHPDPTRWSDPALAVRRASVASAPP